MDAPITCARSLLFVPASMPERIVKALGSDADSVIVDLEDAVAPQDKERAREALGAPLAAMDAGQLARTIVRINASGTPWLGGDLSMLRSWIERGLAGVMVPKSESAEDLAAVAQALGPQAQLVALVESLAGLDGVNALAAAPQVVRLAMGNLDFQFDLGMRCDAQDSQLAPLRFALVAASRRASLPAPVDGVTADIRDADLLRVHAWQARAWGFAGKLCIHPAQAKGVNEAFSPSQEEVAWARRVVNAAQQSRGAVCTLDGRMVDAPVIRQAEQTLRFLRA